MQLCGYYFTNKINLLGKISDPTKLSPPKITNPLVILNKFGEFNEANLYFSSHPNTDVDSSGK